jgi:ABC-type phosphate transport system permease subunit
LKRLLDKDSFKFGSVIRVPLKKKRTIVKSFSLGKSGLQFVTSIPESESDHRQGNIAAAIALTAIVCIVCMVIAMLHFRGL